MVVTRNVFSHRLTVHRKYDLKVGFFFTGLLQYANMYRLHTGLCRDKSRLQTTECYKPLLQPHLRICTTISIIIIAVTTQ